jgi:hypothetical protein
MPEAVAVQKEKGIVKMDGKTELERGMQRDLKYR